jgi:hypothetical protein
MRLRIFWAAAVLFSLAAALRPGAQDRGFTAAASKTLGTGALVGRQWAVFIAIDRYQEWGPLSNPVRDAREIRDILTQHYYIDEVRELYNQDATAANIRRLFEDLRRQTALNDSVFVFYAGHGQTDEITKSGSWIPVDGGRDQYAQANWLPNIQVRNMLTALPARHVFLIADACFSGDILDTNRSASPRIDSEYYRRAYSRVSRQVMTSGASESVPDSSEFALRLKSALTRSSDPCIDPEYLFLNIRQVRSTQPLLGYIRGSEHQAEGSFLFFRRNPSPVSPVPVISTTVEHPPLPAVSPPQARTLVLGGRSVSLPPPFSVSSLGTYELRREETISNVLVDPERGAYSLISRQGREYYVSQGGRGFGPFPSINYTGGAWSARNRQGQYFVGSAGITNGPISDPAIAEILSVWNLDNRRLAYTADISGGQAILQNGLKREGPYDWLGNLHIAPVTGNIAYEYQTGGGNYLSIGGETLGPFTSTNIIGWSQDGRRCAYQYRSGNTYHIIYGGYARIFPEWISGSFAPDGKTLIFTENTNMHLVSDTGFDRILSANGRLYRGSVSQDGRYAAYTYIDAADREWIVLVRPDGGQRSYGPFQKWSGSYSFSPNPEVFFCTGTETNTGRQLVYVNDEKYLVSGNNITPVFSAQDGKYAAFIADVYADVYYTGLMYTDSMIVEVSNGMENTILSDGTPVYWTGQDHHQRYLNISNDSYGPFDYALSISDAATIRWLICGGGKIQIVSIKR